MNADALAKALGGRKTGSTWIARCPAHDDRMPSLSIRQGPDGKVLVKCFAGCAQGNVIAALRSSGLWAGSGRKMPNFEKSITSKPAVPDPEVLKRSDAALRVYAAAGAAKGTIVEAYLRGRGLVLPLPPRLRFHPGLKHPQGKIWPAMVAPVTSTTDGTLMGIHRTFLTMDGSGKAPVEPAKMMLGPCAGGAVHLAEPDELLMVGEGIETCLAAMQATGNPAWAALSTSGLRALVLPAKVRKVIILADADDAGAGEAAAQASALRWVREGRTVRIARPPNGMDFNDLLSSRKARDEEAA